MLRGDLGYLTNDLRRMGVDITVVVDIGDRHTWIRTVSVRLKHQITNCSNSVGSLLHHFLDLTSSHDPRPTSPQEATLSVPPRPLRELVNVEPLGHIGLRSLPVLRAAAVTGMTIRPCRQVLTCCVAELSSSSQITRTSYDHAQGLLLIPMSGAGLTCGSRL